MSRLLLPVAMAAIAAAIPARAQDDPPERVVLRYSAPEGTTRPRPGDVEYSTHEPGSRLWVADEGVAIRRDPDGAEAPARLRMGEQVSVLEVGREAAAAGLVNAWLRVRRAAGAVPAEGWVFGGLLTPIAFEADLDGDPDLERASVAFGPGFAIRVRVGEPGGAVAHVDVPAAGGAYVGRAGGATSADLVPAGVAGIALLRIDAFQEACADYTSTWIAYAPGDAGRPGRLSAALQLAGLSDPPVHSSYAVSFDPVARQATVTRTESEESEDGQVAERVTRETYAFREGVYVAERAP